MGGGGGGTGAIGVIGLCGADMDVIEGSLAVEGSFFSRAGGSVF